jgi:predicted MPP superfamily phosphohydrolase
MFFVVDALVAIIGLAVARLSFRAGGAWDILGWLAVIGEVLLVYGLFIEPRRLAVRRYREPLVTRPTTWIRIAFLSDFHAGAGIPREWWERVTIETNALAPDIVLLGGDYVVDHAESMKELEPLRDLKAPQGVFFVLGNHDHLDHPQEIRSWLVGAGFADLTNRSITIHREGHSLDVQGLDDHWYGAPVRVIRSAPGTAHVLLAHEPDIMLDLEEGMTDLVFTGHAHGGQVRLPLIGAPWIPARLGRWADGGRKVRRGVPVIFGRGLGQERGRPRIGARPEIVIVEVGI